METGRYKVNTIHKSWGSGYQLDGPGLRMARVFRGEESRERLEDIADLMNFAFEQGRRVIELDQRETSGGGYGSSADVPSPAISAAEKGSQPSVK